LYFGLQLAAETIRVRETDLNLQTLGDRVVRVRFAHQRGGKGRLTTTPEPVEVVHEAAGGALQQG
jgi:hypothetical protein